MRVEEGFQLPTTPPAGTSPLLFSILRRLLPKDVLDDVQKDLTKFQKVLDGRMSEPSEV